MQVLYSDGRALCSRALFPTGDPRVAEMYELSLEPGCEERASAHIPGTREQLYVTDGQLVVEAAGNQAVLQSGDVLFFCADRPHRYHNPGREPMRCILVMLYPKAVSYTHLDVYKRQDLPRRLIATAYHGPTPTFWQVSCGGRTTPRRP